MPISTDALSSDDASGFTLLELAIVLFVMAVALSFVIPRFRDTNSAELRASAGRLASTTRLLYDEAAFRQRPMRLNLDLDHHRYWASELDVDSQKLAFIPDQDPLGRPVDLPAGVAFEDVVLPALGTIDRGVVYAQFSPQGFADPLVVHLQNRNGEQATLAIEPLTGRARIAEGYIEVTALAEAYEDEFADRR